MPAKKKVSKKVAKRTPVTLDSLKNLEGEAGTQLDKLMALRKSYFEAIKSFELVPVRHRRVLHRELSRETGAHFRALRGDKRSRALNKLERYKVQMRKAFEMLGMSEETIEEQLSNIKIPD